MTRESRRAALLALLPAADACPGYAMCRIDFLGTGVCPAARERKFAAYYPQGRLRLARAIGRERIAFTPAALEIARSCVGCGICNKQCHFTAELRPMELLQAFGDLAEAMADAVAPLPQDPIVEELAAIVGREWVTDDPAHRIAYAGARSPRAEETLPRYVVLPSSSTEVAALIKAFARLGLPYVARGSGTSLGGALTTGVVIDTVRMDRLEIDERNWLARIGPGVLAFDLQAAAARRNLRANVAEPAACVCANIINTNMHSLFSHALGLGADHVVEAEFVSPDGELVTTSDADGPNPFQFHARRDRDPGVCTGMAVRLFPRDEAEEAVLVPFGDLAEAAEAARRLARRRIGVALGVMGTTYMAAFAGNSAAASAKVQQLLEEDLGIRFFLLVVGHRSVLATVKDVAAPVIEHATITRLLRALPHLDSNPGLRAMMEAETGEDVYKHLFSDAMLPLLTMTLGEGPASFEDVPPDLRRFYQGLSRRDELFDPVWLNTFRILPARMGRGHQFVSQIGWVPLSPATAVRDFNDALAEVAERHGLDGAFGYFVPIDHGTRAVVEFDFYFSGADAQARERVRRALADSALVIEELTRSQIVARRGAELVGQGMARYQSYLFSGRSAP